jgi:hypothetical protein
MELHQGDCLSDMVEFLERNRPRSVPASSVSPVRCCCDSVVSRKKTGGGGGTYLAVPHFLGTPLMPLRLLALGSKAKKNPGELSLSLLLRGLGQCGA